MIAVCPVGPPRSVTIARTLAGSSVAVSAGARSPGDEHERMTRVGDPRHRQAEEMRDRTVADVVEVGRALGEVAAGRLERSPVLRDRHIDRMRGVLPRLDQRGHAVEQHRVAGDHRLGDQHVAGRPGDRRGSLLQVLGDCGERVRGAAGLAGGVEDALCDGRKRGRWGEPGDRPDRLTTADPEPV